MISQARLRAPPPRVGSPPVQDPGGHFRPATGCGGGVQSAKMRLRAFLGKMLAKVQRLCGGRKKFYAGGPNSIRGSVRPPSLVKKGDTPHINKLWGTTGKRSKLSFSILLTVSEKFWGFSHAPKAPKENFDPKKSAGNTGRLGGGWGSDPSCHQDGGGEGRPRYNPV